MLCLKTSWYCAKLYKSHQCSRLCPQTCDILYMVSPWTCDNSLCSVTPMRSLDHVTSHCNRIWDPAAVTQMIFTLTLKNGCHCMYTSTGLNSGSQSRGRGVEHRHERGRRGHQWNSRCRAEKFCWEVCRHMRLSSCILRSQHFFFLIITSSNIFYWSIHPSATTGVTGVVCLYRALFWQQLTSCGLCLLTDSSPEFPTVTWCPLCWQYKWTRIVPPCGHLPFVYIIWILRRFTDKVSEDADTVLVLGFKASDDSYIICNWSHGYWRYLSTILDTCLFKGCAFMHATASWCSKD